VAQAAAATYVASKNLAELRRQLGEPVTSSLRYAPLDKLITKPQTHEQEAISFALVFGHVRKQWTEGQEEAWILLYPPTKEGGQARIEFVSYDEATDEFEKHDGQNISSTAEHAAAFKMPKKASRGKFVALARYYFLEKLAAVEAENNGLCELKFPLPVNKGLLDSLKTACCEFEDEAKKALARSDKQSHAPPSAIFDSQDSDTTIMADAPPVLQKQTQGPRVVPVRAAPRVPKDTSTLVSPSRE
jgi:hypothetical protein